MNDAPNTGAWETWIVREDATSFLVAVCFIGSDAETVAETWRGLPGVHNVIVQWSERASVVWTDTAFQESAGPEVKS